MRTITPEVEMGLIKVIGRGLPLVSRPYEALARRLNCTEQEVIFALERLLQCGDIKRLGVVVRHRKLGYKSNGMVVWNIPDEKVEEIGQCFSQYPFVTLCYQRPRYLPDWPYNLFCMVHGKDKSQVYKNIQQIITECQWAQPIEYDVLFSKRCFKQRGALYACSKK